MSNKNNAIKAAYGEYWNKVKDYVDENGWCIHPDKNEMFPETDDLDSGYVSLLENTDKWMPTPLDRIIDNNGWTRIESEEDLPKEKGDYWVVWNGKIIVQYWLRDNPDNPYNDMVQNNQVFSWMQAVTHYQPIETPKPPIF